MRRFLLAAAALGALDPAAALAGRETIRGVPAAAAAFGARDLETLSAARRLDDLLRQLSCARQAIPTFTTGASGNGSLTCLGIGDLRMVAIYAEHNRTRSAFGSQPLVWDPMLAVAAQSYSGHLARIGRLVHAPRAARGGARENLLRARSGMVVADLGLMWIGERRLFMPGVFPHVSRNRDWTAVAHYTQMVWPTTTRIGCGITSSRSYDWVVCRYSPPGNRDGVYLGAQAPRRT